MINQVMPRLFLLPLVLFWPLVLPLIQTLLEKHPLHSNKHYILQQESVCGSQGTSCRAYNASFCYFVKPFSPPQARTPAHAPEPTDKGSKIIGNTPKCHLVLLSLSLQLPNCVPISGATLVNP